MRRGQTEVLAALLTTLIVVAAFAVLWLHLFPSYLKLEQASTRSAVQVRLAAMENLVLELAKNTGESLNLTVRNTGSVEVTLLSIYINETLAWAGSMKLQPGQSASILASMPASGTYFFIKLCSTRGNCWTFKETGLLATPPPPPPPSQVPLFEITSYNNTVYGSPGSSARLVVVVANRGSAEGTAYLEVYDHDGALVSRTGVEVQPGSSAQVALTIQLPSAAGTWTWTVKVFNSATNRYDDEKSFTVRVIDLLLLSRAAFIWERFEQPPSGWSSLGGTWSIVSGGWLGSALQGVDNDKGPGGVSAYYRVDPLTQSSFQAVVKLKTARSNDRVYRGYILLAEATQQSSFYEVSTYPWGNFIDLAIYYYREERQVLSGNNTGYVSNWYTLYLAYTYTSSGNSFFAILYDDEGRQIATVTALDPAFQPRYLGLDIDWSKGAPQDNYALFDELVVATGDPRYVNVTGLPSGWRVELWQGATLVASATADTSGNAALNVLQKPIIEGATFKIVDERGQIVLSKNFDLILGGDTYRLE